MTNKTAGGDANDVVIGPPAVSAPAAATATAPAAATRGWLAYDDGCPMCRRMVARFEGVMRRRGVEPVALSVRWVREALGLRDGDRPDRMWLLLRDGRRFGGADAAIEIGRRVWWAWPFAMIAGLPGVRWVMQKVYLWIAKRRTCDAKGCATPSPS